MNTTPRRTGDGCRRRLRRLLTLVRRPVDATGPRNGIRNGIPSAAKGVGSCYTPVPVTEHTAGELPPLGDSSAADRECLGHSGRPCAAVEPVVTATDEKDVFDANFAGMGAPDIAAVVFCGPEVGGLKTLVNDQLSPAAHWDAVNIVLERLFASPPPRRYAVIKTSDLPGGAA